MQRDPKDIKKDFTEEELSNKSLHPKAQYTDCNDSQQAAIQLLRYAFSQTYRCMDELLKDNREASIAYTKLEEAQMWAIKGITRSQEYGKEN